MLKGGRQQFKQTKSVKKSNPTHKAPSQHRSPQAILQRAQSAPSSLTPQDILQLQRTIGNRAVQRLLSQQRFTQPRPHTKHVQRTPRPIKEPTFPTKRNTYQSKWEGMRIQRHPFDWLFKKKKRRRYELDWELIGDPGGDTHEVQEVHGREGDDPVNDHNITDAAHRKDLLYGLAGYRSRTHSRMTQHSDNEDGRIRTIDKYNAEVGLKGELITLTSAIPMIYKVRQALYKPKQWKRYLPASKHDYPSDRRIIDYMNNRGDLTDIEKWMTFLVRNKHKIGLDGSR